MIEIHFSQSINQYIQTKPFSQEMKRWEFSLSELATAVYCDKMLSYRRETALQRAL